MLTSNYLPSADLRKSPTIGTAIHHDELRHLLARASSHYHKTHHSKKYWFPTVSPLPACLLASRWPWRWPLRWPQFVVLLPVKMGPFFYKFVTNRLRNCASTHKNKGRCGKLIFMFAPKWAVLSCWRVVGPNLDISCSMLSCCWSKWDWNLPRTYMKHANSHSKISQEFSKHTLTIRCSQVHTASTPIPHATCWTQS